MSGRPLRRALVVDDDASAMLGITALLALADVEVRTLDRGAEAVRVVRDYRPELVVLDIGLPDGDGRLICAEIRKTSEAAVLLVSGDATPPPPEEHVAFLRKPFGAEELSNALAHLGLLASI